MTPKQRRALYVGGGAAAVVGGLVAIYLVSKKSATAPAATTTTTTLPASVGGGVTMKDGAQTLNATSGTIFSVGLPAGGTWVSLTSAGLNGGSLLGATPAGSAQPVNVTAAINDVITGVWQQNGMQHTGTIQVAATLPTVAA